METSRRPEWLKIKVNVGKSLEVTDMLRSLGLNTVCEAANCPNKVECFTKKTATFMILGSNCTRNCTFCNVEKHETTPVDPQEPENIADAIEKMGMKHVVITSVTRDDLSDGGSNQFAAVIQKIKVQNKKVTVEVLIPDFQGDHKSLLNVIKAHPEIINHNIETVPRLYSEVRPMAIYERSLKLLASVKKEDETIITKSGIMVGLGETYDEVMEVFRELRSVDCDVLTIGQYLAPSKEHHEVVEYIHPEQFALYKEKALELGFKYVASAPFVRSSYNAFEAMDSLKQ
ncbi:lipoyl synthase [Alkalibacter rhizosphaerae]|uniref:Lipoyl synthase n=1 Tax=Alkalibacter rhizosphaerae TaxID=2815577 RepID=A0A974XH30_9FIRM|nr:lipoyl synthase [Alkalibacter rhizosphaerae]QSX08510.1 lipoyl synthase [Alkalibacter rhizosphaerae]